MIYRRQFLKYTAAGAAALAADGISSLLDRKGAGAAATSADSFKPDLDIALSAQAAESSILPGDPTRVWRYRAQLIKGDPASLQLDQRSYLGPIIRARTGQNVRIRFANQVADETIIHWHGLHVPADMDGHPRFAIPQGGSFDQGAICPICDS